MAASYNSLITGVTGGGVAPASPDAGPLIPLQYADQIISLIPAQSVARKLFRTVNMGHQMLSVPVLDVLPQAEWVDNPPKAEEGGIGTTSEAWKAVQLTAQTVAVNVPIPRTVLADSMFPIWSEVVPHVAAALGQALDKAVVFGQNSPFAAPALVPGAIAVGNVYTAGTNSAEHGSLANDIAQLLGLVEAGSGFDVNGIIASKALKTTVRNARTTFGTELTEISTSEWYGQAVDYLAIPGGWAQAPVAGLEASWADKGVEVTLEKGDTKALADGDTVTGVGVPAGAVVASIVDTTHFTINKKFVGASSKVALTEVNPVAVAGDFTQAILGLRQDLEFQLFTEGAITDANGKVTINLMTQNFVNLRVTARFGYAVANSVTYFQPDETKRYPFGVLLS